MSVGNDQKLNFANQRDNDPGEQQYVTQNNHASIESQPVQDINQLPQTNIIPALDGAYL